MAAFDFLFLWILQVFSVRTCYNYMSQRVYLRKIKWVCLACMDFLLSALKLANSEGGWGASSLQASTARLPFWHRAKQCGELSSQGSGPQGQFCDRLQSSLLVELTVHLTPTCGQSQWKVTSTCRQIQVESETQPMDRAIQKVTSTYGQSHTESHTYLWTESYIKPHLPVDRAG